MKNSNVPISIRETIEFLQQLTRGASTSTGRDFARETAMYKPLPLYAGRFAELLRLYPLTMKQFLEMARQYSWPTSETYKERFTERFVDQSPEGLLRSYREQDLVYAARLMLGYHRSEFIAPFLDRIEQITGGTKLDVLDYGCGVADISLGLAARGHHVTIVDIDIPRFSFTQRRFAARNLPVEVITLDSTESVPDLGVERYDLAIATEVFEHVRSPRTLLEQISSALRDGGLMLNSMGIEFERERGGDHLEESLAEGASEEFWKEYWNAFDLVPQTQDPWLFQRRGREIAQEGASR
jgi:2-polyprenyl-3-methyl-5-hydroxy-6-metoxy-1,4-benzoquinol methylase